ncbi:MAG: type II toxin-antitoxin system VapB family antitoxin [Armatimonadota bacterium]
MRTTVNIPEGLLEQAMEVSGAQTKSMAIAMGLQELINKRRIDRLRALGGRLDLELSLPASRKR